LGQQGSGQINHKSPVDCHGNTYGDLQRVQDAFKLADSPLGDATSIYVTVQYLEPLQGCMLILFTIGELYK
jgi:hypothetical protein